LLFLNFCLTKKKKWYICLTYIFLIGTNSSKNIISNSDIDPEMKVSDWTDEHVHKITKIIQDDYKVEGMLRSEVQMNIKRLMDIVVTEIRHRKGLPVRGQNTQTNARTRKGKRKTVANKKKVTK
jgi:small subunit ribosomal protein S13